MSFNFPVAIPSPNKKSTHVQCERYNLRRPGYEMPSGTGSISSGEGNNNTVFFVPAHYPSITIWSVCHCACQSQDSHNASCTVYYVTHSNYRPKSPLTKFIVCCVLLPRLTLKYLQQSTPLLLTSSKSPSVTLPDLLDKALFTFFTWAFRVSGVRLPSLSSFFRFNVTVCAPLEIMYSAFTKIRLLVSLKLECKVILI